MDAPGSLRGVSSARGSRGRIALGVAVASVAAGCAQQEPETPAACLAPAKEYLAALEAAPGPVRLDDSASISECLVDDQPPADISTVGQEMIAAATRLNAEAREEPAGDASVELGYLIGAAQEAATETGGLHTDLVRRLDAAARFNGGEPLPVSFERAFGEGYAAGQESG
jgi:hypothetical protein